MKLNNSIINKPTFLKDTLETIKTTDLISREIEEFSTKMRTSKPLEPLEEDIVEISERDIAELRDNYVQFEDFDNFFRMSELSEYGEQSEFYDELQYSIDDIPIADSINPNKKMFLNSQMHTHYLDTDLDADNIFKLKLINYYDVVTSAVGSDVESNVLREMVGRAACLEDFYPKSKVSEAIGKSILYRENDLNYPSSDLLDFMIKRPNYRKDVVIKDINGNETYNRCFGSHFDKLLNETRDVKTIKKVLADCSLKVSGKVNNFDWQFADFGVELFKKTKTWGEKEENLINSIKDTVTNPKDNSFKYETVNRAKLIKANKLLKQDTDIEEIIKQISEEKVS